MPCIICCLIDYVPIGKAEMVGAQSVAEGGSVLDTMPLVVITNHVGVILLITPG